MAIETALHEKLIQKQLSLAIAESCTGGALSTRFTRQAGASNYFLGGVIAYSNEAKTLLLDVPEDLIAQHGAVSAEVAAAMAWGARTKLKADIGLATTGVAGPGGGSPQKPVGTVWIAISIASEEKTWLLNLKGSRDDVIHAACEEILIALNKWII